MADLARPRRDQPSSLLHGDYEHERAWLLRGHLLCGAGQDGLLVRLGKDRCGRALAIKGIVPISREAVR